jgi:hypothetical protein
MVTDTELQVTTNYSFLRGASHIEEQFVQAAMLGLPALGIADRNSLTGTVLKLVKWISGVAIMTPSNDLVLMDIRMPSDLHNLAPVIIKATREQNGMFPFRSSGQ